MPAFVFPPGPTTLPRLWPTCWESQAKGIYHFSSLEGGTKYKWALELADLAGLSMDHITPNRDGSASVARGRGNTQLVVEKIRHTAFNRFTPFREVARSVLQQFSVTGSSQHVVTSLIGGNHLWHDDPPGSGGFHACRF